MAKTYINSVKYMIKISFEVSGAVDKPDIVGAIFGQSEGLLGEEMDLKELQKNGKIGRIEITHSNVLGKTRGEIDVPSSMDMVQTSLLAAAMESVDKVGPYDSKFKINTIDDVRTAKRQEIKSRAQEILERFKAKMLPDTTELTESLREGSRTAEITAFGPEKLPAGPEVGQSNEIIVVEGRADVINLLKSNIKNAIAMNGSQVPQSLADLSRQREVTLFVDGDRGGQLIARNFCQIAKADYVAKAPDGKEVEELATKEIIQSLRKKVKTEEFLSMHERHEPSGFGRKRIGGPPHGGRPGPDFRRDGMERGGPRRERPQRRGPPMRGGPRRERFFPRDDFGMEQQESFQPEINSTPIEAPVSMDEQQKYAPIMTQLKNSLKAKLFDEQMKEIKEVETKSLVDELDRTKGVSTVVFDGIITKRLVDAADKNQVSTIVGARKGIVAPGKAKTIVLK